MPRKAKSKGSTKNAKAKKTKKTKKKESAKAPEAEQLVSAMETIDVEWVRECLQHSKSFSKAYEILEQIGRGEWAFVCKARERSTGRLVAVKIEPITETSLLRTEKPVLLALQTSPYVPELIDYFQSEVLFENDEPKRHVDLLVMELLDACAPFESVLNSFEHPLRTGAAMMRCLQSIHKLGVVHGDISLGNFMHCTPFGIRLLDFGSAFFAADAQKGTLGVEGTLQFTSAYVDMRNTARFADDAEAAVFVLWRMMLMKPLPWVNEANDAARSKMKEKPKGMPPNLLAILHQLRERADAMPDYDAICASLDPGSVLQPDRPLKEFSLETRFRVLPQLKAFPELTNLPFLSAADVSKLQKDGIKDQRMLFDRVDKLFGDDDIDLNYLLWPRLLEHRKVVLENYLCSLHIKKSTAQKFAEIYVPRSENW